MLAQRPVAEPVDDELAAAEHLGERLVRERQPVGARQRALFRVTIDQVPPSADDTAGRPNRLISASPR